MVIAITHDQEIEERKIQQAYKEDKDKEEEAEQKKETDKNEKNE
jgi:hypothetical protein